METRFVDKAGFLKKVDAVIRKINPEKVDTDVHIPIDGTIYNSQIDFVVSSGSTTTYVELSTMRHPRVHDFADLARIIRTKASAGQINNSRYLLVSPRAEEGKHIPGFFGEGIGSKIEVLSINEFEESLTKIVESSGK